MYETKDMWNYGFRREKFIVETLTNEYIGIYEKLFILTNTRAHIRIHVYVLLFILKVFY